MKGSLCSHFRTGHCRSCAWIDMPYDEQLQRKEQRLRDLFAPWGAVPLEETVPSPPLAFRDRAKLSVTGAATRPVVGLLGERELDEGRILLDCPIHHPRLNEVIQALHDWIRDFGLTPYRIQERQGELKGVILFRSPRSEEMYLRFILRSTGLLPQLRAGIPRMQAQFPDLVCISANIQSIPHAILEGPEEILLTLRENLVHRLGPWSLALAPQAFVQTNTLLAERLYATASEWIGEVSPRVAFDLYCGQGAFTFFAAHQAQRWLGVEVNAAAVQRAKETALTAALSHVSFECADAREVEALWDRERPDLVLVNPPRAGIRGGARLFEKYRPAHWIYSSCNAETLAADLAWARSSYELKRIRIFDLFPHTEHFETLVHLVCREEG